MEVDDLLWQRLKEKQKEEKNVNCCNGERKFDL